MTNKQKLNHDNALMLKALEEVDEQKAIDAISDPNLDGDELSGLLEVGLMGKIVFKENNEPLKFSNKVLMAGILNKINQIEKKMKRFKIIDPSGRTENTRHETIQAVVDDLLSDKRDLSLESYRVECLVDEIEITADELLEVWREGERPEDLQFF